MYMSVYVRTTYVLRNILVFIPISILAISNTVGFPQTAHTLHVYGGYQNKDRRETLYDAALIVARNWRRRADWLQEENDTLNSCTFYDVDMADLLEDQYYQCGEVQVNYDRIFVLRLPH